MLRIITGMPHNFTSSLHLRIAGYSSRATTTHVAFQSGCLST